ncbi:uncharacterized protein LOC110032416 [Phalaenopsis equestris]|uniref:uncharacterized protein LOC110032416 n=1 Tax=Phalaenopsis equestris TaxID=78828 RepID=UPI0009E1D058|nr:uncharacterized protein LOC110032416 [Phalaenopsis equestris]XP_020591707.1 uncharacterized protein LOC110032416 [Phalaenopsis equestris]
MRVHPAPKKRSITFRYGVNASFSEAEAIRSRQKKLRRLPHIFSKVLELPFRADAHVSVAEDPDCFRFVASAIAGFDGGVRAHAIQIYPGVMKIVIRESETGSGDVSVDDLDVEDLELDRWRFRLPPETRPSLATAEYADGELIVIVPKGPDSDDSEREVEDDGLGGDLMDSDINRLVLVQ